MFQIIPAIDLLGGKVVRLTKGNYDQVSTYSNDPAEVAKLYNKFAWLHLVDLDGAKAGKPVNLEAIKNIRKAVNCKLELGGGLRTKQDIEQVLGLGIDRVILGSIALKNKPLTAELLKDFGDKIVIGIDAKNEMVSTEGWLADSQVSVFALLSEMAKLGAETIICTDINKDGLLQGPNIELYKKLVKKSGLNIIASGGVSKLEDIKNLKKIKGLTGVIVGKALYENKISLEELQTLA